MDLGMPVSHACSYTPSTVVQTTRVGTSAPNVRTIHVFLRCATCAVLGLVGSGFWVGKYADGCLETALHFGGCCCISNDESVGVDIHARLDAPLGRAVAALTPNDLFDWCVGDPALLVA